MRKTSDPNWFNQIGSIHAWSQIYFPDERNEEDRRRNAKAVPNGMKETKKEGRRINAEGDERNEEGR